MARQGVRGCDFATLAYPIPIPRHQDRRLLPGPRIKGPEAARSILQAVVDPILTRIRAPLQISPMAVGNSIQRLEQGVQPL